MIVTKCSLGLCDWKIVGNVDGELERMGPLRGLYRSVGAGIESEIALR